MKTKLRLKRWVSTAIYLSLIAIVFVSMIFVSNVLESRYGESLNMSFILKDFIERDTPVANIKTDEIIKPYDSQKVLVDIDFYDKDSEEESQQKS